MQPQSAASTLSLCACLVFLWCSNKLMYPSGCLFIYIHDMVQKCQQEQDRHARIILAIKIPFMQAPVLLADSSIWNSHNTLKSIQSFIWSTLNGLFRKRSFISKCLSMHAAIYTDHSYCTTLDSLSSTPYNLQCTSFPIYHIILLHFLSMPPCLKCATTEKDSIPCVL